MWDDNIKTDFREVSLFGWEVNGTSSLLHTVVGFDSIVEHLGSFTGIQEGGSDM
jgi:hypothetical protein